MITKERRTLLFKVKDAEAVPAALQGYPDFCSEKSGH
jgi:hypothetical protein